MSMYKFYSPFSCQSCCEWPASFTAATGKFTRASYQIFSFFTKWALTGHQNTSNHFISPKKLPSSKCLPCTNLRPGQRTVAQKQPWKKSERWSQICCMTKYILNNNWIHAEMKSVTPNKKYLPYTFSSFFKAAIYSC